MKKLTIITINRNNLEGLRKTIASVVSQTWRHFEYIVIDGASCDGSAEYIASMSDAIDYWISEKDSGVYEAMNKGVVKAQGEYLLFLNSGDFLVDKEVLSKVFDLAKGADILCGQCAISEKGVVVHVTDPPEFVTFKTLYDGRLAHQSTFIKRTLFETIGLYREDFRYNADIDFWYKAIIIHNCTTERIAVVVSDYNLDGISSMEHQSELYLQEKAEILVQSNFKRFVPDYISYSALEEEVQFLRWIERHPLLRFIVHQSYSLACKLKQKK